MAAYSYLHPALFLDSANFLIQNSNTTNHHHHNPVMMMSTGSFQEQACHDIINSNTTSLGYYPSADNCQTLEDVVQFHERSNCEEKNSRSSSDNEQSLITTTNDSNSTHSSSLVGIHNNNNPKTMEKKRKNSATSKSKTSREGSCISSGESKNLKETRSKKPRKCAKKTEEEKKESPKNEVPLPPQSGYIHVRARRGQATDSHSLAERVRRERISERMKLLQSLVPGCDKVTGKAPMLDEIINYVQALQNQVEFLSLKLASVNPIFYDYGVDLDAFLVKSENCLLGSAQLPWNDQYYGSFTTEPNASSDTINRDNHPSFQFQQSQTPNLIPRGNEDNLLLDQRQMSCSTTISQSLFKPLYF